MGFFQRPPFYEYDHLSQISKKGCTLSKNNINLYFQAFLKLLIIKYYTYEKVIIFFVFFHSPYIIDDP